MGQMKALILLLALTGLHAARLRQSDANAVSVNPIRRVVTLLQQMQKKVAAEGKREEELFEKFMCYCKNGASSLQADIDGAETKIPQVEAAIKEAEAEAAQLKGDLKQHKTDREDAKAAVAEGKALRAKENAAYKKESSDLSTNIAALGKAITALEKGMSGGFLQTSAASVLKQLTIRMELSNTDRDVLTNFLSDSNSNGYSPQSGEITGILKQMKDTMEAELKASNEEEAKAVSDHEGMVAAKNKQIESLTASIESKTARVGEVGVELVNMKEDLDDTGKALIENKKFLADLAKNCATKKDEWAVRQKTRSEELLAIADTIKILNDDDALELFKKTLPTPSLLEVRVSSKDMKLKALGALTGSHDSRIDLISLALRGRKVSFAKVIKMIDEMVALLGKEQEDDEAKKAYCEAELDKNEDARKAAGNAIADLGKEIEETTSTIATLSDEIDTLTKGIKTLDKEVAEQTQQRKEEHAEFVETTANNNAAKELLGIAKNRLNKFYNPKLYKAPPKRELSEEERVTLNMGGTLAPTAAPGGIAGTGVALVEAAPGPPPETWGAYQKKGESASGVTTMIDMLVADLDKEIQEMEVDEKHAQQEYEEFTADAAAKRTADSKSITEKEGAKADSEDNLVKLNEAKKDKVKDAMNLAKTAAALHSECDWLVQNFDARKEARTGEVDSLKNAKAILSGADYS